MALMYQILFNKSVISVPSVVYKKYPGYPWYVDKYLQRISCIF